MLKGSSLLILICLSASVHAEPKDYLLKGDNRSLPGRFYIEFNGRGVGMDGHAYVVLGREGQDGVQHPYAQAGFYPRNGSASPVKAVLPGPGSVHSTVNPHDTRESFTVYLTESQERTVLYILKNWDTNRRYDYLFQNCVSMARDIAKAIGLKVNDLDVTALTPRSFVRDLSARNTQNSALEAAKEEDKRQHAERLRAHSEARARNAETDRRAAENAKLPSAREARIVDEQRKTSGMTPPPAGAPAQPSVVQRPPPEPVVTPPSPPPAAPPAPAPSRLP